ncbi:hypothetical protein DIPPA_02803 [Diplonema papillatum]|nr:hypothetical protein DIPPA_02803 [Diplonema papillatum]
MLRATRQVLRRGATTVHKTTSKQPARKEASSPEPVGDMSHEVAGRHAWAVVAGLGLSVAGLSAVAGRPSRPTGQDALRDAVHRNYRSQSLRTAF